MKFKLVESVSDRAQDILAYHGSQRSGLKFRSDYPLYLTNDKDLAIEFARGYAFNYDLQKEDKPTLYTIEARTERPKIIKEYDEYERLMDITNADWSVEEMEAEGYDSAIYEEDGLIYYMIFNPAYQAKIVKEEYVGKEIKESIESNEVDSEGNPLTKEQVEFFKNSKVRDNQGRLFVCYHGTDADFQIFDKNKIGYGNKSGIGFYFNVNKKLQYKYDYPKTVYLNITNPITDKSNKISDEMWKRFRDVLGIDTGDLIVSSNDTSDAEVYYRLSEYYESDNVERFLKAVQDILKVDGIIKDDLAVAFEPNQIKSITNKTPTNSNNINEDKARNFDKIYEDRLNVELAEINNFLSEFDFKVELYPWNEYVKGSRRNKYAGMFLNSIQDDAKVFPISLNKEMIVKESSNADDISWGIIGTLAHEVGHGIVNYLKDFHNLDDIDEEEVVEDFAEAYGDGDERFSELYKLLTSSDNINEENLVEVYPNKGESKKDFISRFMKVTKDEYPDMKQRFAVANSYWQRRNKK